MATSGGFKKGFLMTKGSSDGKVSSLSSKASSLPYRGLPTELIDQIFSHCDRDTLIKLAVMTRRFYLSSVRLLYETFLPSVSSDVVMLKRRLQTGFGPKSVDNFQVAHSIAENIRSIDIPQWKFNNPLREYEYNMLESVESLVHITSRTVNLRSFRWSAVTFNADTNHLWKSLQSTPVKELVVEEATTMPGANIYKINSKLWQFSHLSKIHLQLPYAGHDSGLQLIPGLVKMLQRCPTLQDLAVKIVAENHCHLHRSAGNINGDALFQLPVLSNLEKLDFQEILASSGAIIREFLTRLEKVKHLRLVRNRARLDPNLPPPPNTLTLCANGAKPILLPALETIETDARNLEIIAPASMPTLVDNVFVEWDRFEPDPHFTGTSLTCLSRVTSVRECHLLFDFCTTLDTTRPLIVSVLQSIPINVQRLALRMPHNTSRVYMEKKVGGEGGETSSFIEPLGRLKSLQSINLPWSAILYSESSSGGTTSLDEMEEEERMYFPEKFERKVLQRARNLATKLAILCPKLKWVYLQGCGNQDTSGNLTWKVKWCEREDVSRRWALKIDRKRSKAWRGKQNDTRGKKRGRDGSSDGPSPSLQTSVNTTANSGASFKGSTSKTGGTTMTTGGTTKTTATTSNKKEKEAIRVTFKSTSCLCVNCYKNELAKGNTDECEVAIETQLQGFFNDFLAGIRNQHA